MGLIYRGGLERCYLYATNVAYINIFEFYCLNMWIFVEK